MVRAAFRVCLVVCALSGAGCATAPGDPSAKELMVAASQEEVYVSIQPRLVSYFERTEADGSTKIVAYDSLDNAAINRLLALERSFASIEKVDGGADAGFISSKFSASAGKYRATFDYAKYRGVAIVDPDTKASVQTNVGVGARVVINVVTKEANLDLGSLFAIALAARAKQVAGTVEVTKIGIESQNLNLVLPAQTTLDEASLQAALQAVVAIRSKIYDSSTVLTPHVLQVLKRPTKTGGAA
jgi:hypothetical protein